MSAREAVAEAICKAHQPYLGSSPNPRLYLFLAEAAISALQLTEEWTWSWPNGSAPGVPGYGFSVSTREEAEAEGGEYNIVSRFVSAWRAAE